MILSDSHIKERINNLLGDDRIDINPYDPDLVQPASVDIRLDEDLISFTYEPPFTPIDVKDPESDLYKRFHNIRNDPFTIEPGEFILGNTLEKITVPNDIAARVEGKSSLGRLGLIVHATAGFVDPGWNGNLTLELGNLNKIPIKLYYGMKIGQITFIALSSSAERPYGSYGLNSKYQGDTTVSSSRIFMDYEEN